MPRVGRLCKASWSPWDGATCSVPRRTVRPSSSSCACWPPESWRSGARRRPRQVCAASRWYGAPAASGTWAPRRCNHSHHSAQVSVPRDVAYWDVYHFIQGKHRLAAYIRPPQGLLCLQRGLCGLMLSPLTVLFPPPSHTCTHTLRSGRCGQQG